MSFGQLWRQLVGIPMGSTNCAPPPPPPNPVADLFLFCSERDFMLSLSWDKKAGLIEALSSTSRYLDDLLNVDNTYFDSMVNQIYPSGTQLNKGNSSDTDARFWIYIWLFPMVLFLLKFIVSSMIFILMLLILHLTGFIYLSSFGSLECLVM